MNCNNIQKENKYILIFLSFYNNNIEMTCLTMLNYIDMINLSHQQFIVKYIIEIKLYERNQIKHVAKKEMAEKVIRNFLISR